MKIVGRRGDSVLLASGSRGVLINESTNSIIKKGSISELSSYVDDVPEDAFVTSTVQELGEAALTGLNIEVLSSTDRMHTIPKAVVAEAKRALEWRKEHKRGGTSVGLNTARTLAGGGQIGIKKIRHIAKYFPRHEVDKKGKGYRPGEDGYPSNGRIAWGLWGGDAAKKWATAIVERENKKLAEASMLTTDYYSEALKDNELQTFSNEAVSFAVRMKKKSKSIDRLYQIGEDGKVYVWDDGRWDDLGNIENDFDTYDRSLDDPYDQEERVHFPIDAKSALVVAGILDSKPFDEVSPSDISYDEYEMVFSSLDGLDWEALSAITAAGEEKEPNKSDGKYTPEERSEKAKKQFRDRTGKFGKVGGRVQIGSDPNSRGILESVNPDTGIATVKKDDGSSVQVPVSETQPEKELPVAPKTEEGTPVLDTSGILGETKEKKNKFKARLSKKFEVFGPEELKEFLSDYPNYVEKKRQEARDSGPSDAVTAAAPQQRENEYTEPSQSDVAPIYMAIVAKDDPQAVMEVVALVPASAQSNTPMIFKRKDGKWEKDDAILADLNSPTPPPVIVLDMKTLEDVLKQVDSAVTASALSIRNAEKLKNYWLSGEGSSKIKWKSSGSWTRCVENLSKYMGENSAQYCAYMHKVATGNWVGDPENKEVFGLTSSGSKVYSVDFIIPESDYIEKVITNARISDAKNRVLTASAPITEDGSKFYIPLVIPEGVESGDGRIFKKDSIDIRDLPLPLLWQIKTGEGHNGSVVVGRIDTMEKTDEGIGNARGVFDSGTYGKEAERLVRGGFIRGVSADLDKFEASEETKPSENAEEGDISTGRIKISKARVMAVTLVPKPAFQECTIKIVEDEQEEEVVPDGVYVEGMDPSEASSIVACGMVAGAIPTIPPASWFDNPKLNKATPLTVTDEGQVFGHIAAWHVDHIGMGFGTKPPRSRSKYAYFHTGVVRTEDGTDVPVGQLTLAGGHASLEMSAREAVRHYDDTASAIADVHAGEDAYGIWVAGALRPGTTPEQIRALRASAPSGDWRPIKGHLELVAVCQVNVPGFPIARARVASGQVMALVAAGASTLAHMKSDPVAELNARIDRLEKPLHDRAEEAKKKVLAVKAEELSTKMKKVKKEIDDDLSWMIKSFDDGDTEEELEEALSFIPLRERKVLVKRGHALPDGSFPIRNVSDLKNAIRAYGRAKPGKRSQVRKHIMKRAIGLEHKELIPEEWRSLIDLDDIPESGMTAAVGAECPPATQDIALNLQNRKNAIDTAMYGPLNPAEPNEEYWAKLGEEWGVDVETAKKQTCGNCAVFVISPSMKECISSGLTDNSDEFDSIDAAGELGYCEAFDFKCASARTCRAWVAGGPVTEDKPVTAASGPCWDGYEMVGFKMKDGKKVPNCVPIDSSADTDESGEFSDISKDVRERLASEGKAMPDGSYPIRNVSDLKNAIQAFGRAKESEKTAVRKHIVKRARGLGRQDLIPENWPEAPKYDQASVSEFKYFSPEKREEMAKKGLALPDGSYPIENERDLKNAIWAFGRAKPSKKAEVKDHIIKRAKALNKEDMLPEVWEGEGSSFSDEDDDELTLSLRERIAIVESMVAAGGLDRNRGNAERLRRYWTRGPGALKIRWGTPGDWKRCVRYLAKYMGPRAKGYCQLRHKEATGVYTGSRFNPGRKARNNSINFSENSSEFSLSEALSYDGFEKETIVTENDLLTPIEWIMEEFDEFFDEAWEPEQEVVIMMNDLDSEDDDDDSVFDSDDDYYEYTELDSVFASKEEEKIFEGLTPEEVEALKKEQRTRESEEKLKVRKGRYTPKTQPRDAQGKFRKVLARLKVDLGTAGLDRALKKVEEIENLDFSGDYGRAAEASKELISIIDRIDTKALNPDSVENVRASSAELGRVIANLPFAFGEQAKKIRYSDVPPAMKDLIEDMITRVEAKIGKEDADEATAELRTFMSGGDYFSQSDISAQMAKLLRLLT